jgi:hypothetical protein
MSDLRRFEVYRGDEFGGHGVMFEDGAIACRLSESSEVINVLDPEGGRFFVKAAPTAGLEIRWVD